MEGKDRARSLQEVPLGKCLARLPQGTIFESIIGTRSGSLRPLGLWRTHGLLQARIYPPSPLLEELRRTAICLASFTQDALLFYDVMRGAYEPCLMEGLPYPCGASLLIKLSYVAVVSKEGKPYIHVYFAPARCLENKLYIPAPYTRANALLLEILVHYTRIEPLLAEGIGDRVFRLLGLMEAHAAAIARIAPGSRYEEAAQRLLEKAWEKTSLLIS